ncbi:polysaccharide lyase family 3 protein [Mixia osmundae IAM 14324]|uniref:Pectate lyase n=1 Tax=Mixia osmundae (strain CBS 9802 / IAM 14324 / JCM 22182 / KY 12970) TaxID=764103 RepID=G7DX02_MIXOS|nr:polysaccharide lyase family 3 protein [Mixia osmundae IAM 14324]KEI38092.1 polysaccharide lyase family 3 protein [Mixia osmundae IAM 14324]GAA95099.1 hypothetical protein E5Q_01754 [Mixia osmundae IAM 14324]
MKGSVLIAFVCAVAPLLVKGEMTIQRRQDKTNSDPDGTMDDASTVDTSTLCSSRPTPSVEVVIIPVDKPIIVAAGQTFDGGYKIYKYGDEHCDVNREVKGDYQAPFVLEDGASLTRAFLWRSQESVHLLGSATITDVHWMSVCDEAIAVLRPGKVVVSGCTFSNGPNKALQLDGSGVIVSLSNSCLSNIDIGAASCGNCVVQGPRTMTMDNIESHGVRQISACNTNYGDSFSISKLAGDARSVCDTFHGNDNQAEPFKATVNEQTGCCKAVAALQPLSSIRPAAGQTNGGGGAGPNNRNGGWNSASKAPVQAPAPSSGNSKGKAPNPPAQHTGSGEPPLKTGPGVSLKANQLRKEKEERRKKLIWEVEHHRNFRHHHHHHHGRA